MKQLTILWQFSRPHTIIGSACSITTLYLLALAGKSFSAHAALFWLTLLAALGCNVFIVGLNQLIDIELDKINKPWLPLAAGSLTKPAAHIIIFTSLAIALVAAAFASWLMLVLIIIICLLGIAYSVPPVQLKKHHLPAAICIALVRGVLVNVGILLHYHYAIQGNWQLPGYVVPLTVFIVAFSIAIAWYKDLPDTEGDAVFHFKTFPLLYKKTTALWLGAGFVLAAYGYAIHWGAVQGGSLWLWGHVVLLFLFIVNLFNVRIENKNSIKQFYLRFWIFFFSEYILLGIWAL
jgi:homogentisate phytyltransferase / homogentisate geranylgeranyltransferase